MPDVRRLQNHYARAALSKRQSSGKARESCADDGNIGADIST